MRQLRVNERIRISQVRVIGEDGAQLGVMVPADALRLARECGLDLVEVAPPWDPSGMTAVIAASLVREMILLFGQGRAA